MENNAEDILKRNPKIEKRKKKKEKRKKKEKKNQNCIYKDGISEHVSRHFSSKKHIYRVYVEKEKQCVMLNEFLVQYLHGK